MRNFKNDCYEKYHWFSYHRTRVGLTPYSFCLTKKCRKQFDKASEISTKVLSKAKQSAELAFSESDLNTCRQTNCKEIRFLIWLENNIIIITKWFVNIQPYRCVWLFIPDIYLLSVKHYSIWTIADKILFGLSQYELDMEIWKTDLDFFRVSTILKFSVIYGIEL